MTGEIVRLLREAGVAGELHWRDLVMFENYAPVPPLAGRKELHWSRGFNLVVLSRGRPAFFVKCRPGNDPVLERATAIRSCLSGRRPGGVSVTEGRFTSSERICVEVSPFLRGPALGTIVGSQPTSAYLGQLRTVLVGQSQLSRIARHECEAARCPTESISLSLASADSRAHMGSLGAVDRGQQAVLADVVAAAGEVAAVPQHGDFWSQNLLVVDGDVWVIDFEEYGHIQVPLYDDLTLILATLGSRAGGVVEGVACLLAEGGEGQACRELLAERAAAEQIATSQLDGILVFYLTTMASQIQKRGGADYSRPHVAAVRFVADRLAAGTRDLLRLR